MTQDEAFEILKTGANVFLTGEPGSGKTYMVNRYISWLHECGIFPAITASTGIAATHIGGMTIHSWSGIGVRESLSQEDLHAITGKKQIKKRIANTHVLIIDEVSMLSGSTLGMVDAVCRRGRGVALPFGGLQVVLVGDFFQLPPISRDGMNISFAYESDAWRALNPTVCYLTEQYRQDDIAFLSLLAAIRQNSYNETHHEKLLERFCEQKDTPDDIPKLFSHNADVDRINIGKLEKLDGKKRGFQMETMGPEPLVASLMRSCLSPEFLELKTGAAIMCTKNSPHKKFVNGTLGVVLGFDSSSGYPVIKTRGGSRITIEPMEWTIEEMGQVRANIKQVPLRLAWAITVHKSQGMSMDAAVMDLSDAFEYGQGYVALSRVRRLSGLYLLGINDRACMVHPNVLATDAGFRAMSEAAKETLSTTQPAELREKQERFIKFFGGTVKPQQKPDLKNDNSNIAGDEKKKRPPMSRLAGKSWPRWEQTLVLIRGGKTVEETAGAQGMKPDTIIKHIEELLTLHKLASDDISHLALGKETTLNEIYDAFRELGTERLKPIYDQFEGQFSYETIRLARLLFDNS